MGKLIVAIGREYGSGGERSGKKLANRLGIKSLIRNCSPWLQRKAVIVRRSCKKNDEQPTNSFLYSLVMDTYASNGLCSFKSFSELP